VILDISCVVLPHMAQTSADNHVYLLVDDMRCISEVASGENEHNKMHPAAWVQLAASMSQVVSKSKGRVRRFAPCLLAGVQSGHTLCLAQADGVVEDGALFGGEKRHRGGGGGDGEERRGFVSEQTFAATELNSKDQNLVFCFVAGHPRQMS